MAEYGWGLATALSKLFIYLGIAAAVGGIFISLNTAQHRTLVFNIRRYCLCLISVALVASGANFFIQVGAFAETGLTGMFDVMFIEFLWQSNAGSSMLFTLLALILMLLSSLLITFPIAQARSLIIVLLGSALLLLMNAFTLVGHTAQLSLFTQILLGVHLAVAAWWMGALWPLWRACHDVPSEVLYRLMETFGRYAGLSVGILIVCGTLLGFELVGSFEALFFTDYGQAIVVKLFMVSVILLVAAYHKWKLVPALLKRQSSGVLARSIIVEIYLGIAILAVTTIVSTLTGPAH